MNVVGIVRVSTAEQAEGHSLTAQEAEIRAECQRRGWPVVRIIPEVVSGKDMKKREGLQEAIGMCRNGEAEVIMTAKLDRLTRSVADFVRLWESSREDGWAIHVLDLGIDFTTPVGELLIHVLATFAQFERRIIVERIKSGLQVAKQQGKKCGRSSKLDPQLVQNIVRMHMSGNSFAAIARKLNDAGVPTGQGGAKWYAATVRKIVLLQHAKSLAA